MDLNFTEVMWYLRSELMFSTLIFIMMYVDYIAMEMGVDVRSDFIFKK